MAEAKAKAPRRPGTFQVLAGGLRLCGKTAGIGVPVAVVFGLLHALGLHLALGSIDTIIAMDEATHSMWTQGLVGLAGLLWLYGLVQFGRRFGGSITTPRSWLPVLLVLPITMLAVAVWVLGSMQRDYGPLAILFVVMSFTLTYHSFVGAAAAVCWVRAGHEAAEGRPTTLAEVVREALRSWLDVAVPHGARVQLVQVGLQVLVPGIWYALQYAFVDLVAVLEPDQAALKRSARLTAPIRSLIFRVLALWVLAYELVMMPLQIAIDGKSAVMESLFDMRALSLASLVAQDIVFGLAAWFLVMAMLHLYRWRIERERLVKARKAERAAAGVPAPKA